MIRVINRERDERVELIRMEDEARFKAQSDDPTHCGDCSSSLVGIWQRMGEDARELSEDKE